MGVFTSRLKLFKADGGDVASDPALNFGNGFQTIDDLLPQQLVTSATRPSSPFTGQLIFETDTLKSYIWNGGAWVQIWTATDIITSAADTPGYKNRIVNGDFSINQKAYAPVVNASGRFCDMWRYVNGAGQTGTLQIISAFAAGFVNAGSPLPDVASALSWSKVNSVAPTSTIAHRTEDVTQLNGKQVVLSFWAFTNNQTCQLNPHIIQNFGTGGSPSTQVDTAASPVVIDNTGIWKKYSVVITVPTINGKTLGTNGDDFFQVSLDRDPTDPVNSTIVITAVQIEVGTIATQYEKRPKSLELQLCQRYFQRLGTSIATIFTVGRVANATQVYIGVALPVTMRAAPSLAITGATLFTINGVAISAMAATGSQSPNFISALLTTSGQTAGQAVAVAGAPGSIIDASAEL